MEKEKRKNETRDGEIALTLSFDDGKGLFGGGAYLVKKEVVCSSR